MSRPAARLIARIAIIVCAVALACAGVLPASAGASPSPATSQCPGASANLKLGTTTPVLLVHGFNEGPGIWTSMTAAITGALGTQVTVVSFDYSGESTQWVTNENIGPKLAGCITWLAGASADAGGPGKVIIVAHSMGGLAVRCAVAPSCGKFTGNGPAADIGLLITLGTPNLGPLTSLSAVGQFLCGSICLGLPGLVKTQAGMAMVGLEPGSKKPTSLQRLPSSIPLYAIAGKITVTATLLNAGPFALAGDIGDIGDGIVPEYSALAGAPPPGASAGPHTGPGSGSTTVNCGTIAYSAPAPFVTCTHLTETTDPEWQADVVNAIKAYQASVHLIDWDNTQYTTTCGGIAKVPFTVTVRDGRGSYVTGSSQGYSEYDVSVAGAPARGDLLGNGSTQTAVELDCSPQPSDFAVTEIQVFTAGQQPLGVAALRPPNLVPSGLYNFPYFDDHPLTISGGVLITGAGYYGPNDCAACGASIQYILTWQWNGDMFTLKKAAKVSGRPAPP